MVSAAVIVAAVAAWIPSTAQAAEGVTSFQTTLAETATPLGEVQVTGIVQGANGESFTIEAAGGTLYTVEANHLTTYSDPGVIGPSLTDVAPGDYVGIFGAIAGDSITAGEVEITTPQAGAHPDLETSFTLASPGEPESAKNIVFNAPTGVFGNPLAATRCPTSQFAADRCPPDSQVGLTTVYANYSGDEITACSLEYGNSTAYGESVPCSQSGPFKSPTAVSAEATGLTPGNTYHYRVHAVDALGRSLYGSDHAVTPISTSATLEGTAQPYLLGTAPIFSIVPQPTETARFAFITPTLDIPISIPVTVRTTSDYGLRFTVSDISQITPLAGAKLNFWGFPAAASHTAERFPKGTEGEPAGCPGVEGTACNPSPTVASIAPEPLIDNPTTCTGKNPTSTLEVQTYADPTNHPATEATYPKIEGCQNEVFEPVLQASPTTNQTDSASGLNVDLRSPQFLTKAAEPSELRAATVTLPEGFNINPDAADGQSECKEAEAEFTSEGPAHCPDTAKIGTFSIGTPALPERLEGSVYLGEPKPGDQYRLFLTASGFGMNVKLKGSVFPNEKTGQLIVEFPELPQAPFEDFQLHLFSGERALMATPTTCTVYTVAAEFFPWNATQAEQTSTQIFGLNSGPRGTECPGQIRPFNPSLEAGTSNSTAGAFSSFALKLSREDGAQDLGHVNFTMPPGLTANLNGITYCSDAAIAQAANTLGRTEQSNPSCPASSEIGTSNVAAGPGTHPFHATGKLYLAGPFQGAPLSLVVVTPALAGPYDYGTVVVRVALHIDPSDAHVTADSQAVPEIIGGIPLRIRSIQVNINREKFMIDPTNCSAFTVGSEGIGDQGTAVAFTSPFQAVNCSTLGFSPKMTITQLGGHRFTARGKDPALRFDLNTQPGDANIKSVAVTLPRAFEIDQRHLGNLCDKSELASDQCKGRQPIGYVKDETPLLEKPLEGPAYAVSGYGVLPHIVFILGGQVMITPEAESTTISGARLKTVVPVIPDAPIGHFRFSLLGGSHGYISNSESLCAAKPVIVVQMNGQNGKSMTQQVRAKTACKAKKHKRRARRRRHGRH